MKPLVPLVGIVLSAGIAYATPERPVQAPELAQPLERYTALRELQGTVQAVDPAHGTLYVRDQRGNRLGLAIDDYTTIVKTNDEPLAMRDLKQGDPVHLYYTTWNQRAQHIDRLQTVSRAILGAP